MDIQELLKSLGLSVARGVPQMASGFVDLAALPFTATGLLKPEQAVGSTDWMTARGYLPPKQPGLLNETTELVSSALNPSAAMKASAAGLLGLTAYHGSPSLFKQLNPAKIGTGEGAQAYGAGAGYLAGYRPVAEEYARDISRTKMLAGEIPDTFGETLGGRPIVDYYDALSRNVEKMPSAQANEGYKQLNFLEDLMLGTSYKDALAKLDDPKIISWAENLRESYKPSGYLYKGDIPDEIIPTFLDWDKSITSQPQAIQDLVKNIKVPDEIKGSKPAAAILAWQQGRDVGYLPRGRDIYSVLESITGDQLKASKMLEDAGSGGIRYLDEGSRETGKGTSNFVVFRPEDYKVQEINDIPLEEWIRKGLLD